LQINDGEGTNRTPRTETANVQPTSIKNLQIPTAPICQPWPYRLKPLLTKIDNALSWKPAAPFDKTKLAFETSIEAAETNFRILEACEFDLHAFITGPSAANTPLRPGSEFRPVHLLDQIFQNHPLWRRARRTLTSGFTMPLRKLPEIARIQDVYEALNYGNHKSTQANPQVVMEMLDEEVR
jgi:hypothetical protein